MQSQTMPGGRFSQMGDAQFDAQFALAQMETLAGAISKRGCAVELQDHFIFRPGNHIPRLLPGAAMDRQGIGEAVGRQCQPAIGAIETAFGNAVGPGHQGKAAELAGQAGVQGVLIGVAQQGLSAAAHGPVDDAGAEFGGECQLSVFVFELEKCGRHRHH
ncbi:hypothetical protein D3C78_1193190 [compost metagenome]